MTRCFFGAVKVVLPLMVFIGCSNFALASTPQTHFHQKQVDTSMMHDQGEGELERMEIWMDEVGSLASTLALKVKRVERNLEEKVLDEMQRRARRRNWLPRISIGADYGEDRDTRRDLDVFAYEEGRRTNQGALFRVGLDLSWDLKGQMYDSEERLLLQAFASASRPSKEDPKSWVKRLQRLWRLGLCHDVAWGDLSAFDFLPQGQGLRRFLLSRLESLCLRFGDLRFSALELEAIHGGS